MLEVGGVTPSPATFLDVRKAVAVPVCVLLRPRPGGFVYSPRDWTTLHGDADWFLTHGSDAIVCGGYDDAGRLEPCRDLVRLASGRAVLNRAFDFHPDPYDAMSQAIDLGFSRVLTSGGGPTAIAGEGMIRELIRWARGRIEVLPGGGIKPGTAADLVRATGCDQVHGSFRRETGSPGRSMRVAAGMGVTTRTDPEQVAAVRAELDRLTGG
ncbi:CutC-like protein [Urbifossiella limnaea]|uniref:Copper homeostasis protein cutC homolog n=1 Tax=Urbifossiella limnaea TaxID=2528023 RepID=A0A517XTS2_9BACT|nr:CutC-like protein [Urbifossiella limnaea]